MESNQTLVITGNLFVDGGGDPIVPTIGVFQVLVKSVVPVQAQGIATGSGGAVTVDSESIAAAVWARLLTASQLPGSAGSMLQDTSARIAASL